MASVLPILSKLTLIVLGSGVTLFDSGFPLVDELLATLFWLYGLAGGAFMKLETDGGIFVGLTLLLSASVVLSTSVSYSRPLDPGSEDSGCTDSVLMAYSSKSFSLTDVSAMLT